MSSISLQTPKRKPFECAVESIENARQNGVEFLGGDIWFPNGAITILGGKKRSGKSTLCLYECARFSAMGRKVLIVQREDPEGLLKAKLTCMGADLANILLFHRRKRDGNGPMEADFDERNLGDIIESAERTHADLVYIDPLHGLASGRMNDQKSADCLMPLNALAKRTGCCVLGVLHAHKNPKDVEYAMSGTEQWVTKARSYLYLETDPSDDDTAICQQVDASYSDVHNVKVRFEIQQVQGDNGKKFPIRIIASASATNDTAQDYLDIKNSIRSEQLDPVIRDEIARWVHDAVHLNGNHILANELFRQAQAKGWTPLSVRKAYRAAGVRQTKEPARAPRSILYLPDSSEYTGDDLDRIQAGTAAEQLAKEWCKALPR